MSKPYKTRVDKGVRRSAWVTVACPCGKADFMPLCLSHHLRYDRRE